MQTAAQVRRAIAAIKADPDRLLTAEEERILVRAVHAGIEVRDATDILVWRNIGLARRAARIYVRPEHYEDGTAAAMQGLLMAIERFDPDRGFRFSTYAFDWCRQRARRYASTFQDTIRVAEHMVYKAVRVRKLWALMSIDLGRNPTMQEMVDQTGYDAATIAKAREVMRLTPRSTDDPDDPVLLDLAIPSAEDEVMADHQYDELRAALMMLDGDTRSMIIRHFGLDGRDPETFASIGMTYRTTRQATHSRVEHALYKLRKILSQ